MIHVSMRNGRKSMTNSLFFFLQSEFFISLVLTILGYVPGIVYSLYVILRTPPEPPGIDGERPYDMLA
jgi:hypothetical protein